MSKSTEEFKNLMESDRGEAEIYEKACESDQIFLPITRAGFEAFVAAACKLIDVPATGPNKNVVIGFLHSLGRATPKTSLRAAADAIWNTLSNHATYVIDQEIKLAANQELREEQEKAKKAKADMDRDIGAKRAAERAKEKEERKAQIEAKRAAKQSKRNGSSDEQPQA